jgi:hypothetical protein
MPNKYLLYIDILGFSDLVQRDPRQVEKIYGVLDSLNVHRHNVFHTIVFSDTVLVYNRVNPKPNDRQAHEYLVWYSIEFAEDLHHRLTGQDVYFRAVLVRGKFQHYALSHIDCFFGKALIDAHVREKNIPSIGLFIDSACNNYNRFFRTEPFGNDLHFVYLNRAVENLHQDTHGAVPVDPILLDNNYPYIVWQVRFLRDVHNMMRTHPDPRVRAKFLTTWDFYRRRYPQILAVLEEGGFNMKVFHPSFNWSKQLKILADDIQHFKSAGKRTKKRLHTGIGEQGRLRR